ncbi:MAG: 6-carboxytetrahydropterin synthase [Bacteriovoracaceae bacterium]|nr:6-carboxytetrahydropterin synthase [Bacteriovoracaceae bacterium]
MNITLFYNNITVLDYAYWDEQIGVVGDSLSVNVELVGSADEQGILYDFSYVKNNVKKIIDRDCDHRFIVPKNLVKYNNHENVGHFKGAFGKDKTKVIEFWCPSHSICALPDQTVTQQNIIDYLKQRILAEMPENIISVNLAFEAENLSGENVYFHYTHGLKHHFGNCQMPFHGHRSTIRINKNGKRCQKLEKKLAEEIFNKNIRFTYWENVVNKENIIKQLQCDLPVGRYEQLPCIHVKYKGNQGDFELKINKASETVYFVQKETTIENLTQHFHELVANLTDKTDKIEVIGFEGIAKGAKV